MLDILITINLVFLVYTIFVLVNPNKFMPYINATPLMKRIGIGAVYVIFYIFFANLAGKERAKMKEEQAKIEEAKHDSILAEQKEQRKEDEYWATRALKIDSTEIANNEYYKLPKVPSKNDIEFLIEQHNKIFHIQGVNYSENENLIKYVIDEGDKLWNKELPKIRKAYVKATKDDLWISDIDVYDSNGGKTIWFVGATFAANRNIQSHFEQYQKTLTELGFNKACYKWIKHTNEYTYYNLN